MKYPVVIMELGLPGRPDAVDHAEPESGTGLYLKPTVTVGDPPRSEMSPMSEALVAVGMAEYIETRGAVHARVVTAVPGNSNVPLKSPEVEGPMMGV